MNRECPDGDSQASITSRLLIIWFSRTGGSKAMARAAYQAASEEADCQTQLIEAGDVRPADMLGANGYIFAFPENLAAIAGGMKEFFDSHYYPLLGRIEGRAYGMMICAGSDGENAQRQAERIATGWRLRKVVDTIIICTHAQSPEAIAAPKSLDDAQLQPCRDMGATMATGLALGVF